MNLVHEYMKFKFEHFAEVDDGVFKVYLRFDSLFLRFHRCSWRRHCLFGCGGKLLCFDVNKRLVLVDWRWNFI